LKGKNGFWITGKLHYVMVAIFRCVLDLIAITYMIKLRLKLGTYRFMEAV